MPKSSDTNIEHQSKSISYIDLVIQIPLPIQYINMEELLDQNETNQSRTHIK